jgi:oxygen-dependent protoporphyrinogen oxidase
VTGPATLVIGGGIAGLVTAWQLASDGHRVEVLESESAVGGCIARHTVGGLDLDSGAESFATATPAVADLIAELGLGDRIVAPNPLGAWVRHAGGTAPLPLAALLGIPARPFAADVRRVLGTAGAARAALDLRLPGRFGAAEQTLGGMVGARMGRRVVDRLVEPVAGGVYSTDPDELEVDSVQPRLRGAVRDTGSLAHAVRLLRGSGLRPGAAVAGLSGGLFGLIEALRAAIEASGGIISTGVQVTGLVPDGDHGDSGDGWRLATSDGTRIAQDVVLAVPGAAAAGLLSGPGITVPPSSTATSSVRLVTLVLDHRGLDTHPRGTGVLVSRRASGVTAKALTHATAKWEWLAGQAGAGRHVLRLSYGRGDEQLPGAGELLDLALADASVLTGVRLTRSSVLDSDLTTWTSALPRPQPGHRAAMERLREQVGSRRGLHLTGSMTAGTGLAAVVTDARACATRLTGPTPGGTSATPQPQRTHPRAG